MYHYRKTRKKYVGHAKPITCDFCNPLDMNPRIVYESTHCFVIPNRIFYDVWELRDVLDHLMVIPKDHAMSLQDLSPEARLDLMNVMAKYESENYNIYARTPSSTTRSVVHQHTHLIKTKDESGKGALILKKPYIFVKF